MDAPYFNMIPIFLTTRHESHFSCGVGSNLRMCYLYVPCINNAILTKIPPALTTPLPANRRFVQGHYDFIQFFF